MLRQKIKLSTVGDDASIIVSLKSEYSLGGLSEDIENLATQETFGSINDTTDEEKLRFMPSTSYSMGAYFYRSSTSSYVYNVAPNEFASSATTTNAFSNSFYVYKIFDSPLENVQNLIHTGYINGYDFNGYSSSNYVWNNTFDYTDIFIPYSFLNNITATTFSLYFKLFFYSAKSSKVYPFSRILTPTAELDIYNRLTFNKNTRLFTITTPFTFYEMTNQVYVDLINESVDSLTVAKPNYPTGNTFTTDGEYITVT